MHFAFYIVFALFANLCLGELDYQPPENSPSREIHISDIADLVNTEEGRNALIEEYKSIQGGQRRPWTVASTPENIKKNRYDDLLAYDETRVVLEKIPGEPDSDYINANYIDGFNRPKEYVATQGPLPETIHDFWRMIWQLNSRKIVMLANLFEHDKPKVAKYWPDANATYGNIIVSKLSETSIPDIQHVVRTFSIRKCGESKRRIIRHFHFTGWPDLGVPSDRMSIVSIMRQARRYRPHDTAPLVIHCSAGIGRTGTIILMDSMIQKARAEGKVDFPKRLDHMRVQRPDVVEKPEQYVFAHEAIQDLFFGEETTEYLKNVENKYNEIDTKSMDDEQPRTMADALRRLKWHTSHIANLVDDMVILNENAPANTNLNVIGN